MNKPFNMTRIISLTAAAVLFGTMFTGCFKKDPAPSTEPTGGPNLVEPTTEGTEAPTTEATTAPTETTEAPKKNVATVKEKAGVRSAPTNDSNILSQLNAGDQVDVNRVETNNGTQWAYIPLKGWVDTQYLDMTGVTVGGSTSTPAGTPAVPDPTTETTAPPANNNNNNNNTTTNTTGNAVINATTLNIRDSADVNGKVVGGYKKGDKVTILETKNGWGRTNRGWISMTYVTLNGTVANNNTTTNNTTNNNTTTTDTNAKVIARGLVNTKTLNVRSGAGTNNGSVGAYSYLTRVEITEKKDVDGATWGRTKDGWICLTYVYMDGEKGDNGGTGTVTGSAVNLRQGPGTKYAVIGSVKEGDTVEIQAQFTIDEKTWGCTKNGWISMDYVGIG